MRSRVHYTPNWGKAGFLGFLFWPALSFIILLLTNQPAASQESCSASGLSNPNRQLIRCGEALALEREAGSEIKILERSGNAPPSAIELENGAIFIEVQSGNSRTQIRTPHAIAAVRGTTYVVDVGTTSTAIFVIEGAVSVRKLNDASTVTLRPGEGVDVGPEVPLNVKTWGAERVSALLARFGR